MGSVDKSLRKKDATKASSILVFPSSSILGNCHITLHLCECGLLFCRQTSANFDFL